MIFSNYMAKVLRQKKASYPVVVVGVVMVLLVAVMIKTHLNIVVPGLKFRFIPPNDSNAITIEYSYIYDGSDLIRGPKFGKHAFSEVQKVESGEVVVVPEKIISNYWPFSEFFGIQINGEELDGDCYYLGNIPYNELKEYKDKVLEIECTRFDEVGK